MFSGRQAFISRNVKIYDITVGVIDITDDVGALTVIECGYVTLQVFAVVNRSAVGKQKAYRFAVGIVHYANRNFGSVWFIIRFFDNLVAEQSVAVPTVGYFALVGAVRCVGFAADRERELMCVYARACRVGSIVVGERL